MTTTYLVIADDAVVYRTTDPSEARGYGLAHAEHTGEEFEIATMPAADDADAAVEGGAA